MNIELVHQNVQTGVAHEIGDLVTEITHETSIEDQPGKLTIEMLMDNDVRLGEGDIIRFKFDGRNIFFGRLFKKAKSNGNWTITALDNKKYLGNQDTLVFSASRSHERFANICKISGIPYRIVNQSAYTLPNAIFDQKTYYSMVQDGFDLTLINQGMWYIIRDNFGTLEHVALNSLITDYVIGDQSLLTEYDYSSSIEDSYNVVKLTKDNEETNRRDVYIVKNSNLENRWGTLQYHQSISDDLNPAQIREMANNMLRSMQMPDRKLSVEAFGIKEIKAGNSIVLQLADLAHEGYDKPKLCIISKCTQTWAKQHSMSLDLRVVQ